jgi:hypothetical protein
VHIAAEFYYCIDLITSSGKCMDVWGTEPVAGIDVTDQEASTSRLPG